MKWGLVTLLNEVVRKDLSEKVIFEQRPEESKGASFGGF